MESHPPFFVKNYLLLGKNDFNFNFVSSFDSPFLSLSLFFSQDGDVLT